MRRSAGDAGQALPLFIWVTGIVLFAAFAFFAFAQGAVARNGAQTAADAAALAAANDTREELAEGLVRAVEEGEEWLDWLEGRGALGGTARSEAARLAGANSATVSGFGVEETNGWPGYRVSVEMNDSVGDSIIPGTEGMYAKAVAVSVVEPLCEVLADDSNISFRCSNGGEYEFDADDMSFDDLPDLADMYSVHLVK
ncbi:pilus assembly protein TadG-related protein [Streptomyces koyangensis]|uniref:pilus assembly protein TadG-related protein n=1 Tax=Streptomyces koyangensis TaxID=188770 RepID=UPI003C2B543D